MGVVVRVTIMTILKVATEGNCQHRFPKEDFYRAKHLSLSLPLYRSLIARVNLMKLTGF